MPNRCLLPDGTTTRLPSGSAKQSAPSRDSWVLRRRSPGRPGLQARDPAGNIPLVGDVLATEAALQERFLYKRHGERVEREENHKPDKQGHGAEEDRFAEQDGEHSADHGVAHVAVGSPDHEPPGGSQGASVPSPTVAKSETVL